MSNSTLFRSRAALVRFAEASFVLAATTAVVFTATGFQGKGGGGGSGTAPPPNPEIAFSYNGLCVMNADGSNVRTVVKAGRNETISGNCWSPDGQTLAFSWYKSGSHGIWTVGLNGQGLVKVADIRVGFSNWALPDWSRTTAPDGKFKIAYTGYRPDVADHDVYIVSPDGTGLTNLTNTPTVWEWACAWGEDGSTLYVSREDEIVRIRLGLDGSGKVVILGEEQLLMTGVEAFYLRYANTTPELAFTKSISPYRRIYRVDTASPGSEATLLTLANIWDEASPSYSPDDSKLAFHRGGASGGIFTVNHDGTGEVRISTKGAYPMWKRPAPAGP